MGFLLPLISIEQRQLGTGDGGFIEVDGNKRMTINEHGQTTSWHRATTSATAAVASSRRVAGHGMGRED